MRKNVKLFAVPALVAMLAAGCEGKSPQPLVSDVAEAWLDIRTKLTPTDKTETLFSAGIALQIREFNDSLNRFIESPIGHMYRTHRAGEMRYIQEISASADRLSAAIQNGDVQKVYSNALEIDRAVSILQRVDAELSGASQLDFFLLSFFISVLVMAITLILAALIKKERTENRQIMSFSREAMLAQEHERSRIAMELHDTVAQDILRLSLQTKIIKKGPLSEEQSRLCAEAAQGADEIVNKIRRMCDNLIPHDFQSSGIHYMEPLKAPRLPDAINSLCQAFEKRAGIKCSVAVNDNADFSFLDVDMQLHCFRIVQECLANIEKHSEADEASVIIRTNAEGELLLFVTDNGKGFEETDNAQYRNMRAKGHYGLWNMQERAASMNGVLAINSEAGEGTTIKLIIPPPKLFPARQGEP